MFCEPVRVTIIVKPRRKPILISKVDGSLSPTEHSVVPKNANNKNKKLVPNQISVFIHFFL